MEVAQSVISECETIIEAAYMIRAQCAIGDHISVRRGDRVVSFRAITIGVMVIRVGE